MFKCEEGLQTHYSFGLLNVRSFVIEMMHSFNFYLIQLKLTHDILCSGSLQLQINGRSVIKGFQGKSKQRLT
jgi:hypothetical protein